MLLPAGTGNGGDEPWRYMARAGGATCTEKVGSGCMRTGEDAPPPNGNCGRRLRTSYAKVAMSGVAGEDRRMARGEHGSKLGCEHADEHAEDTAAEFFTESCDERGVLRVGDELRDD